VEISTDPGIKNQKSEKANISTGSMTFGEHNNPSRARMKIRLIRAIR
jgi:hypothetical protein